MGSKEMTALGPAFYAVHSHVPGLEFRDPVAATSATPLLLRAPQLWASARSPALSTGSPRPSEFPRVG